MLKDKTARIDAKLTPPGLILKACILFEGLAVHRCLSNSPCLQSSVHLPGIGPGPD